MIDAPPYVCPYCDKQIPSGRERCPECGAALMETPVGHAIWPLLWAFLIFPLVSGAACEMASMASPNFEVPTLAKYFAGTADCVALLLFWRWRKNN